MRRATVFALCLAVLSLGVSAPRAHALDDTAERVVVSGAIGAAAGGVLGLLIMILGRQGELEDRLKQRRSESKQRATVTPVRLEVRF